MKEDTRYLNFIKSREAWEQFLEAEEEREFKDEKLIEQIIGLLEHETYNKFNENYLKNFALPRKKEITYYNTSKVRVVYVYPGHHMTLLKMTSFYLLKYYNNKFCKNSLAYTKRRSVKSAFTLLKKFHLKDTDIVYKNDFSDYFNSIPLERLEKKLKAFLVDDHYLVDFIMQLLRDPRVKFKGNIIEEYNKGVMAGSPISGILANVYMDEVDKKMLSKGYKYIRYADDTLTVGDEALEYFKEQIENLDITFNPKKMKTMNIKDGIIFLGFLFQKNKIDISEKAKAKMKSRFKRRAKWYRQWMLRRHVKKEVALRDYIKKINYKLYSDQDDSVNWSRWYLPNITTTESIHFLDRYFVDCIRYLDSGTWTKGKKFYRLSYEDIKRLGYKTLVNEYYKVN